MMIPYLKCFLFTSTSSLIGC
uniref:Uncharacterized protein n=1 Tax=Arundo donax TaxID=35708 RepID=A0A0A9S7Q3_ARUDO